MQRWDKLNQRQLAVLEQIAAGDDLSTAGGVAHRTCARALQRRRLVDITRRRGNWRAAITTAGRFYLAHGHHPDHPRHQPPATTRRTGAAADRRPAAAAAPATMALAQQLVNRLTAGDGLLRIDQPDPPTRARYRRAIHAAKQHQLIPDGYQLRHTGRDHGDLAIRLYDLTHRDQWDRFRVATRRQLTTDEDIIAALHRDPTCLAVSPPLLPRALALVRQLAATARARGHALVVNTKGPHPRLQLRHNGTARAASAVAICEDHDQTPHLPTGDEQRRHQRHPWIPPPAIDRIPNGRLVLQINRSGPGGPLIWKETRRARLDTHLRRIMADVEAGHPTSQSPTQQPDPVATEQLDLWHRQAAAERARWEHARAAATAQATDMLRTRRFRAAFDSWAAAEAIRRFCTTLEATAPVDRTGRDNLARWVAWARTKADLLDPTTNAAVLADVDFTTAPDVEDVEPFIGPWSATAPHSAYRDEQTRRAHDRARAYDTTWYRGMQAMTTEPAHPSAHER